MAILGLMLFSITLAISLGTIAATLLPRWNYVVALLDGSAFAPAAQPVAARRRVNRIAPVTLRAQLRLLRAAA